MLLLIISHVLLLSHVAKMTTVLSDDDGDAGFGQPELLVSICLFVDHSQD